MSIDLIKLYEALNLHKILVSRGLLSIDATGKQQITEKGYNLIGETNDWINDWIKLWPTNLNKTIGYSVSGNSMSCRQRMNKFITSNPQYDKDIVMQATIMYLAEQESKYYEFTKKNYKFIYDRESSLLEDYCNKVLNPETNNDITLNFL